MALAAIRYGIPLVLFIAGVVVGAVADSVAGAALFFSGRIPTRQPGSDAPAAERGPA